MTYYNKKENDKEMAITEYVKMKWRRHFFFSDKQFIARWNQNKVVATILWFWSFNFIYVPLLITHLCKADKSKLNLGFYSSLNFEKYITEMAIVGNRIFINYIKMT